MNLDLNAPENLDKKECIEIAEELAKTLNNSIQVYFAFRNINIARIQNASMMLALADLSGHVIHTYQDAKKTTEIFNVLLESAIKTRLDENTK